MRKRTESSRKSSTAGRVLAGGGILVLRKAASRLANINWEWRLSLAAERAPSKGPREQSLVPCQTGVGVIVDQGLDIEDFQGKVSAKMNW